MPSFEGHLTAGPIKESPLYITAGRVARRYEKTPRTIDRWLAAGILPLPDLVIRGRRYWTSATLDRFDAEQKAATRSRLRSGTAEAEKSTSA
jgi:hypothetical protein